MRVALLIAGYLRNYKKNVDYIKNEIINKFHNVDTYIHITTDENNEDKYFNNINDSDIKYIINELKPKSCLIESNVNFSYNKKINNTLNHWYKLYKLNELKKINEHDLKYEYDLVIRLRPDLNIESTDIFDNIEKNKLYIPIDSKIDKSKLLNENDKYICDSLAYGDNKIMNQYFNIFKNINHLISKHGYVSETILYHYLKYCNIDIEFKDIKYSFVLSKCNVFAICGDSGSGKSTISNILKDVFQDSFKLECDRYHKWERGNDNWNKTTHLNPEANYITKMNEDVFNLKLGNEIYQVDYDHSTGKFTEKQLINPANNLIVCGLHSLYVKDNIYNLKIYMDTDENVKNKWKVNRDVNERGYSIEKVLKTIEHRKEDFKQYIDPQKENADIIINFFTNDNIDITDLKTEFNLSLKISVNNNFNLFNILSELTNKNIKFEKGSTKNFQTITFNNYENVDLLSKYKLNNRYDYYDYILFFILNLSK